MLSERILEAQTLLTYEVIGHAISSHAPSDLVFRVGDAESADHSIRFVAHDGDSYRDVAFVTNDHLEALAITAPKLDFVEDGHMWGSVNIGKAVKEDAMHTDAGHISFTVHDGVEQTTPLALDHRGIATNRVCATELSVAGRTSMSQLVVDSSAPTLAVFGDASACVSIERHDATVRIDAPELVCRLADVEQVNAQRMAAHSIDATSIATTEIQIEQSVLAPHEDGTLLVDGPGVRVNALFCEEGTFTELNAQALNLGSVDGVFATFGASSIVRTVDGHAAWHGEIHTDVVVAPTGELELQAASVHMGAWSVQVNEDEWHLQYANASLPSVKVQGTRVQLGRVQIDNDAICAGTLSTACSFAESAHFATVVASETAVNELHAQTLDAGHLRVTKAIAHEIHVHNLHGSDVVVDANSLSIDATTFMTDVEANSLHAEQLCSKHVSAQHANIDHVAAKKLLFENGLAISSNDQLILQTDEYGQLGVHGTPQADLDVHGDCIVRGMLTVGDFALRQDALGALHLANALALTPNCGGYNMQINTSSSHCDALFAIHRPAGSDSCFLSMESDKGLLASIDVDECLNLSCTTGVRTGRLKCTDLHTPALHVGDVSALGDGGTLCVHAGGVALLRASTNGLAINSEASTAALTVKTEAPHAFDIDCRGETYTALLQSGLQQSCAAYAWRSPGCSMALKECLSVSGAIHGASLGVESLQAEDARVASMTLHTLTSSNVTAAHIRTDELRLRDGARLTGGHIKFACAAIDTEASVLFESGAGIGFRDELCINKAGRPVLTMDADKVVCRPPLSVGSIMTERLMLQGVDGRTLALDHAQLDGLVRVSDSVRVESQIDFGDDTFMEATLDMLPEGFLDDLAAEGAAIESRTRGTRTRSGTRGPRSANVVVLADSVRVDGTQLLSNVPIVTAGGLNVNGMRVENIAPPVQPHDAVSLAYLDERLGSTGGAFFSNTLVSNVGELIGDTSQALRIEVAHQDVASFTSTTPIARVVVASLSVGDSFVTTGTADTAVSFGYKSAEDSFAIAGTSTFDSKIHMLIDRVLGHTTFGGMVNLVNTDPLLRLTKQFGASDLRTVAELSPSALHLGDSTAAQFVALQNVGGTAILEVSGQEVLRADLSGALVSNLRLTNHLLLGGISLGESGADVHIGKHVDGEIRINSGNVQMFNETFASGAYYFQDSGFSMRQEYEPSSGVFNIRHSAFANSSAGSTPLVIAATHPSMLVHPQGASIATDTTTSGLIARGELAVQSVLKTHTARMNCSDMGVLQLAADADQMTFVNTAGDALMSCNQLSVGSCVSTINAPAVTTGDATVSGTLSTHFSDHFRSRHRFLSVQDLFVSGDLTAISVETVRLPDAFMQLAFGNPTDVIDTGFVSHFTVANPSYDPSAPSVAPNLPDLHQVAGLIRDASTKRFKFFKSLPESDIPLDALSTGAVVDIKDMQLADVDMHTLHAQSASLVTASVTSAISSPSATIGHAMLTNTSTTSFDAQNADMLSVNANFIVADDAHVSVGHVSTLSVGSSFTDTLRIGQWLLSVNAQNELVFAYNNQSSFRVRPAT